MKLSVIARASINEMNAADNHRVFLDMDGRISQLLEFIDSTNGRLSFGVERSCRELKLDISARHAARLFKRYAGVGFMQYAKRKRLMMAAEWLKATDLSVKAIAAELRYKSSSDFARAFKMYFGLAPRIFRQRYCASNARPMSRQENSTTRW